MEFYSNVGRSNSINFFYQQIELIYNNYYKRYVKLREKYFIYLMSYQIKSEQIYLDLFDDRANMYNRKNVDNINLQVDDGRSVCLFFGGYDNLYFHTRREDIRCLHHSWHSRVKSSDYFHHMIIYNLKIF